MDERRVVLLDVSDVLPNRFQPRIQFDEEAIQELSDSIKRYGLIQPIIVRPLADKYEIIAGERRYKATVMASLPTIPAIILKLNDKESAEIALVENLQRRNLTPIEEAVTYKKVLDMGYLTQNELAEKLGVKQSTVSNKLRLLQLDDEVQNALLENKISERHARSLLKLQDKDQQKKLLARIIKERLTVRRTDEEIKKMLTSGQDEVEILDFDNILNQEGEDNMNMNDPMNQFNIPTPTITDDNPEKPDLLSSPNENAENNVAPGFLDIDRIEKEAQDIGGDTNVSVAPKFFGAITPETPNVQNMNSGFAMPSAAPVMPAPQSFEPAMPNVMPQEMAMPTPQVQTMANVTPSPVAAQPMPNVMPSPVVAQPMPNVMPSPVVAQPMPNVMSSPVVAQPMPNVTSVMPNVVPVTSEPTTMAEDRGVGNVIQPRINLDYVSAIQAVHDLRDMLENRGFNVVIEENDLGTSYNFSINVSK